MSKTIVGIDPGDKHGGIAVVYEKSDGLINTFNMPLTYPDIFNLLKILKYTSGGDIVCYLEDVGKGIPGQSSKVTANFGRHNGHLEMALYALEIPTVKVTPAKWMKFYSNQVGTKGNLSKTEWKNKLKGLAQTLYPSEKITLATSDAILIAHYGKNSNK